MEKNGFLISYERQEAMKRNPYLSCAPDWAARVSRLRGRRGHESLGYGTRGGALPLCGVAYPGLRSGILSGFSVRTSMWSLRTNLYWLKAERFKVMQGKKLPSLLRRYSRFHVMSVQPPARKTCIFLHFLFICLLTIYART